MDKLKEFLDISKASKVLVCIDWTNVFYWKRIKREGRIVKKKEKIDPHKLYDYLNNDKRITEKKIFFGLEKARETVMDNIVRWVNLKKKKELSNLEELVKDLEGIRSTEEISSDLIKQISEVFNEYRSDKIIKEFQAIGFNISPKDVKIFYTSLTELTKFKYVVQDLQKIIRDAKDILKKNIQLPGIGSKDVDLLQEQEEKISKICSKKIKNRKCDCDVDIVVDMVKNLDNFDTFIIFSGDGDYAPAVNYILEKGKNIAIISVENQLGREFGKIPSSQKFSKIFADNIEDIWLDISVLPKLWGGVDGVS